MKEAIVAKDVKVSLHDVPIPTPAPDQVLIKVIFAGSNPKDWKFSHMGEPPLAAMTAAVGLYLDLGLPEPWKCDTVKPLPLIVYGGSSAVV